MIIDKTGNPLTKELVVAAAAAVSLALVTFLHFVVAVSHVQSAFTAVASQAVLLQALHLALEHALKVHAFLVASYSQKSFYASQAAFSVLSSVAPSKGPQATQ